MTIPAPVQTVMVTGASAGIGRAVVQAYAARGARIGLIARGRAGLEAATAQCLALGASAAVWAQADVADAQALFDAAATLRETIGEPDVWVNSAMVSVFAPSWEVTPAEFLRVTEVCYLGTVHGTLAALETMRKRRRGVIVQVSSALAYRGIPLQSAYCASKHAVEGFTDSLRAELAQHHPGIAVTMVNLSGMNTPLYGWMRSKMPRMPKPAGPIFEPEEAAQAVLWAARHTPRTHNLGVSVPIRVAQALAPSLFDRYLAASGQAQQLTAEPDPGGRPDNVDKALDEDADYGARGTFSARTVPGLAGKWRAALG